MYPPKYTPVFKTAATRQVKEMRRLAEKGDYKALESLARQLQDEGVLKVSGPGTNLRRLGAGAESINDLVVGAGGDRLASKRPLTVRKVFDKLGPLYSDEQLSEKINLLRRLRNTRNAPLFTEVYGGIRKAPGGARYTLNEFVPEFSAGSPSASLKDYIKEVARDTPEVLNDLKQRGRVPSNLKEWDFALPRVALNRRMVNAVFRKNRDYNIRRAEREIDKHYPVIGNPTLFDLHGENVVRLPNAEPKVLDFSVIPAHRLADRATADAIYREEMKYRQPKGRREQLNARLWQAMTGSPLPASSITERGLEAGPKTGKNLGSVLSELGPKKAIPRPVTPVEAMPIQAPVVSEALQPAAGTTKSRLMDFLRRQFEHFRG